MRTINIRLHNNYGIISKKDEYSYSAALIYLRIMTERFEKRNKKWRVIREPYNLFKLDNEGNILVPHGLVFYFPKDRLSIEDRTTDSLSLSRSLEFSDEELSEILKPEAPFLLRFDQISSIRKIFYSRRGLIQLATGAGKSEIMAAVLRIMNMLLGYYPKTIVIEPTLRLVEDIVRRFRDYKIPATSYRDHRDINHSEVIITHPRSLGNDILKKDPKLLHKVTVVFWDESQHLSADTWSGLLDNLISVVFALGMSASVVDPARIHEPDIRKFLVEEALAIGATGNILINIPMTYYVKEKILASPVLFQLKNSATEEVEGKAWFSKLESSKRTGLMAKTASFFASHNRKVIILIHSKNHGRRIALLIRDLGFGDVTRLSFGGFEFEKCHPVDQETVNDDDPNIMDRFGSGEIKILIATSHLLEGVDVPHLDVVIFGVGGKRDIRLIQGIGRGMRKTKTGLFAYLIDFTDHGDQVLARHSNTRLSHYKNLIGVPKEFAFKSVNLDFMKQKFLELESIPTKE